MPRFSISQYSQISQLFFIFHFPPFSGFSPTIFNPLLNYGTTIKLSRSANKNKTPNSLLDFSSPTTSPPIHPKLDSHSVSPTKPRWSHQNQLERFASGQIFDFLWSFTRLCAWKSLPDVRKHVFPNTFLWFAIFCSSGSSMTYESRINPGNTWSCPRRSQSAPYYWSLDMLATFSTWPCQSPIPRLYRRFNSFPLSLSFLSRVQTRVHTIVNTNGAFLHFRLP